MLTKILSTIICLFLLCGSAEAFLHTPKGSGVPTGGGGYVLEQSQTVENDGMAWGHITNDMEMGAGSFVANGNYPLTKMDILLAKVGSPTSTITMQIWSATGTPGYPNVSLGTSTNTHTGSEVDGSTYLGWTFSGISLTSGVHYIIVPYIPDNDSDPSNYYLLRCSTTADGNRMYRKEYSASWSGSDWSSNIVGITFKAYSGTP